MQLLEKVAVIAMDERHPDYGLREEERARKNAVLKDKSADYETDEEVGPKYLQGD